MATIDISDAQFETEVLQNEAPVLVDFWAPWCGPCLRIAPDLKRLSEDLKGRLKVVKINVDDHQEQARVFGVQGIPKLILFKGGEQVAELTGVPRRPLDTLHELVKDHL